MANKYKTIHGEIIVRVEDGVFIPADKSNTDYQDYLKWCAEGNTPDPAPPPSTDELVLAQIAALEATVTERRIREAVLGIDNGWLKDLNDQIVSLRAQLTK